MRRACKTSAREDRADIKEHNSARRVTARTMGKKRSYGEDNIGRMATTLEQRGREEIGRRWSTMCANKENRKRN